MLTPTRCSFLFRLFAIVAAIATGARAAAPSDTAFAGRWALTISNGAAGWLEVKKEGGHLTGSLLWGGGSVVPLSSVTIADGVLTVKRVRAAAAKAEQKQPITDTFTAQLEGDTLKGRMIPGGNGDAAGRLEFTGKRTPPLPARPNLAKVKFGEAITLFNGRDLTGWRLIDPKAVNAWSIENGALANKPAPHGNGKGKGAQPPRSGNLRTDREFEDFNLTLEVSVPAGSNSGVYLRGIYEVQVFDSYGKGLDSHNMGAIYSRITPTMSAEKPAGEWQTLDITLVDRHATVILNGKKIIDNQPIEGCTGGAMWSDQFRPGPIYLQGDHGAVSYRNLTLRPVVK